jgi:hypothetical protein
MTEVVTLSAGVPAPATLVGAIAAVMNELHTVAKRGVNEFHRYRYATMGDILKEITPLLGGLSGACVGRSGLAIASRGRRKAGSRPIAGRGADLREGSGNGRIIERRGSGGDRCKRGGARSSTG